MDRNMYVECARAVVGRLRKEVNGLVRYEVYPEVDTIIFKVIFKDFDFNYGVNYIQDVMYNEGFDTVVDDILSKYKKAVNNAFFKTDARKERDRLEELGIKEEMFA